MIYSKDIAAQTPGNYVPKLDCGGDFVTVMYNHEYGVIVPAGPEDFIDWVFEHQDKWTKKLKSNRKEGTIVTLGGQWCGKGLGGPNTRDIPYKIFVAYFLKIDDKISREAVDLFCCLPRIFTKPMGKRFKRKESTYIAPHMKPVPHTGVEKAYNDSFKLENRTARFIPGATKGSNGAVFIPITPVMGR